MEYFVLKGHDTTGPFSEEQLRREFAGMRLNATDLVRPENERHWTPLRKLLDEMDAADDPVSTHVPHTPDVARVMPPVMPESAPSGLFALIRENPVGAGLAGVAFAGLLAFLARWPLLVALPGLVLGVGAGLILMMRQRPIVGGVIGLAAILVPLALQPRSKVPAPVVHGIAPSVSPPLATTAAPNLSTPSPSETHRPALDVPVEEPKAPASAIAEAPKPPRIEPPIEVVPVFEPPATSVAAIPSLPVAAATPAPVSASLQIPPPVRAIPGKAVAAAKEALASLPPIPAVLPTPSSAKPSRPEDLVFLVETGVGSGSGFLAVDRDRVYFFTNLHVISGAKKIIARSTLATFDFKDGNVEVATDRDLVRFAVPVQPALQFGDAPKVDDAVVALGNSGGREVVTRLEGKVLGVGPAKIEVSSEFIPGNSGGPLIDKDNRVLGLATYLLRGENVPDWIKSGTRFSTTRRFGVRVTDDVKWESMPLGTLVRQTVVKQTGEELLTEYIAMIKAISDSPLQKPLSTKFSEKTEVRLFVDDYNRACRDTRVSHNGNKGDYVARLRDQVGKLSRTIRSTGSGLRRDLGNVSKGYAKELETDLLGAFDELATAIDKDERELFHL